MPAPLCRFTDASEVEFLTRCVRRFDADGLVEEASAAAGQAVLKAGLAAFPNDPALFILAANFALEVGAPARELPAPRG